MPKKKMPSAFACPRCGNLVTQSFFHIHDAGGYCKPTDNYSRTFEETKLPGETFEAYQTRKETEFVSQYK